ncbi:hypothetical protein P9D25_13105 [Bacillus velezensis]|uniref:hypothetical protein n=1 Tax=Bacillus velezensis TaxID=492670 RepID=UPI002DB7B06B|nr:hypothetical protein [Bacillus velezensis]MEC1338594.1 hypothetical protein [Bacillus velezensis]
MNSVDEIKKTVKYYRYTFTGMAILLAIIHYTVYPIPGDVLTGIAGTVVIAGGVGELFYMKLIEKLEKKNGDMNNEKRINFK